MTTEAREHPKYYNNHPKGIECRDVVEDFPFNLANAMKYIWRAGLKPGAGYKDDLEKAIHYLQRQFNRSALYEPHVEPGAAVETEASPRTSSAGPAATHATTNAPGDTWCCCQHKTATSTVRPPVA